MTSYLLSWLRRKYETAGPQRLEQELPGEWIVWEPGKWQPPSAGKTLVGAPGAPAGTAGEALAIALRSVLKRPFISIGRGSDNDVVIDDGTLSRVHLVLMKGAQGWTVRDGGSSNGTFVAGKRLEAGQPAPLASGMRLRAGAVELTFYDGPGLFQRLVAPR